MAAVCDSKFKFSPFHCFVCCLLQIARCLSFAVFRAFCRAASRLVLCSPVFNLVISLLAHSDRKSCLQSRLQSGHSSQSGLQSPSVSPTIVLAIFVCNFVFTLSWMPKLWRCWHSIVKWNHGKLCRMARNARYGTCKRVIREAQSKQKWKQIGFATPNEPAICCLFFLELFAHMWRRIFFVWRKFEQSKHTPLVLLVRMQDNTTLHNAFSGMTADTFEAIAICNFLCSNPTTDFRVENHKQRNSQPQKTNGGRTFELKFFA